MEKVKLNDQWVYGGVTYTVERDEQTDELYFKHPSERAGSDDHIAIEHAAHGEVIYKEDIQHAES